MIVFNTTLEFGLYLKTVFPLALVGYEMVNSRASLAITISYPTSASGISVFRKTPKEKPQNRLQSLQKDAMIVVLYT